MRTEPIQFALHSFQSKSLINAFNNLLASFNRVHFANGLFTF
jgi:hypothetical protein